MDSKKPDVFTEYANLVRDLKNYFKNLKELDFPKIYMNPALVQGLGQIKRTSPRSEVQSFSPAPEPETSSKTVSSSTSISSKSDRVKAMEDLAKETSICTKCALHVGRTNLVFGQGDPEADLVIVGEAPGQNEDIQGIPFVGRSGQLLTKMIEATGLKREEVYICNVLKCRPPENRDPKPEEVALCEGIMLKQLEIIQPKVILAMGRFACQSLLNTSTPIGKLRGTFTQYHGMPLMPTFHPAYLLRNPSSKREAWADIQQVMEILGLPIKK